VKAMHAELAVARKLQYNLGSTHVKPYYPNTCINAPPTSK
jgi:hypothetical protein